MRVGYILFWALICSIVFFLVMHVRSAARTRRIEELSNHIKTASTHMEQMLRMIHSVCVVLAETWPEEGVRVRLKAALILAQEPGVGPRRRATDIKS